MIPMLYRLSYLAICGEHQNRTESNFRRTSRLAGGPYRHQGLLSIVGKAGVEPAWNQLTFQPRIRRRVYLPRCARNRNRTCLINYLLNASTLCSDPSIKECWTIWPSFTHLQSRVANSRYYMSICGEGWIRTNYFTFQIVKFNQSNSILCYRCRRNSKECFEFLPRVADWGNYDIPTLWLTVRCSASELPVHWGTDEGTWTHNLDDISVML